MSNNTMEPPRLAWIGLGNMGRGMVKNIVEKGDYSGPLLIYNRTPSRAEQLLSTLPPNRAKITSSIPEAVANSDIIFFCLSNDAAIQEAIQLALNTPLTPSHLLVDCSTIHPDTTTNLHQTITTAGANFLACPVFGAPPMAASGQLICVPAGPAPQITRILPFLQDVTARAVINYSDQPPSAATRLKIIGNTFILSMIETLAAGHVLAEKSGLGSENLHAFIEQMFPGPYTAYSKRMLSGDYYLREEPAFAARLARKDAGHARSLGKECGVVMKGLEVADGHLEAVVEYAGDKGDIAGIYGAVRREAGLKFENREEESRIE